MSRRSELRILDILDAIDRINTYVQGQEYNDFLDDMKTQDAVARNIEIIGEAARSLPQDFKNRHSDIPWKEIVGMRNIVIHEYFGVMPDVVWDVIKNELPKLKQNMQKILKNTS